LMPVPEDRPVVLGRALDVVLGSQLVSLEWFEPMFGKPFRFMCRVKKGIIA
jgi:hypothetical protein